MSSIRPLWDAACLAVNRWHFARLNPLAPADVFYPAFFKANDLSRGK